MTFSGAPHDRSVAVSLRCVVAAAAARARVASRCCVGPRCLSCLAAVAEQFWFFVALLLSLLSGSDPGRLLWLLLLRARLRWRAISQSRRCEGCRQCGLVPSVAVVVAVV